MSQSQFLNITSQLTTGQTSGLTRSLLIVTRESVTGFTIDSTTGLYKINASDLQTFITANPTSLALISNLNTLFGQVYSYPHVYILSASGGVTSELLTKANARYREWSFITVADTLQCSVVGVYQDRYLADIDTIVTWNLATNRKILFHTISAEETDSAISIPVDFQLLGDFQTNRIKTVVSNDKDMVSGSTPVYRNTALAILSFCINGIVLARSWGSFSDAHDLEVIKADTYSNAVRSYIENQGLAQYNDKKDKTGKNYLYDTLMNKPDLQIEALTSADFIEDYTYVYVNNVLTAAGNTGLTNDDAGIQKFVNLIRQAISNCFANGLILSKPNGSQDASVSFLTASQVSAIDSTWQATGVWVNGMFVARVRPFAAAHYITINFIF